MELEAFVFVIMSCLCLVWAGSQVETADDMKSGSMKFTMPDLNDDETHSRWIPDQMKCEACQAVSYQLWDHFEKFNQKHKYKKYNLLESDIIEITEEVCSDTELFNAYGIKEMNKVHHLTGPGIEGTGGAGVIAGGGKWPARLRDMCDQFMGRIGEEKIYAVYKKEPKDQKRLQDFLCRGPANTVRGECSKVDEVVYDGDEGPVFGAKKFRPEEHKRRGDDDDDDEDDEDDYRDEL